MKRRWIIIINLLIMGFILCIIFRYASDKAEETTNNSVAAFEKMTTTTNQIIVNYLEDEQHPVLSDAARDLAERAMRYTPEKPLYVVAIGAITNVASALLLKREIAERMVVVWLGGNALHWKDNTEFNCK